MRVLLDTHVLLWWLSDSDELPAEMRHLIADGSNVVYVSAATVWEIEIKRALGKLKIPEHWATGLAEDAFRSLPITAEHALRLAALPKIHRDPFDRMLVAQAMVEGLVLLSSDATVRRYGVSQNG